MAASVASSVGVKPAPCDTPRSPSGRMPTKRLSRFTSGRRLICWSGIVRLTSSVLPSSSFHSCLSRRTPVASAPAGAVPLRPLAHVRRLRAVGPERSNLLGQRVQHFLDLAAVHMPREDLEHGPGRVPYVDGARTGKLRADALQELVQAPRLIGQLGGPELIVVGPAHQKRQLRAEMGRKIERDAVANPA